MPLTFAPPLSRELSLNLGPLPHHGYRHALGLHSVDRLDGNRRWPEQVRVAEEVPVALVYNGRSHAVVMASPTDLEELAVGFSVTEGIVSDAIELQRVEVVRHSRGIELQLEIPAAAAGKLDDRRRSMSARTGCGLCGVEELEDALRLPPTLPAGRSFDPSAVWAAGKALNTHQPLNTDTRSVHAAAWCGADGSLKVVREDVGRHNALDKVIGALLRSGDDPATGFLIVTSRASYELVVKAGIARVVMLAAVSRPTGLAIRIADQIGLTLLGLLRGDSANVYSHGDRVQSAAAPIPEVERP